MLRFAHLLEHVGVIIEEMFAVGADRLEARMSAADQIELTHQTQGAIVSRRERRPYFITEHGIYTKERIAETSQATWIHDPPVAISMLRVVWTP